MAVEVINDAWDIKGDVVFDEYNHKTKKSKSKTKSCIVDTRTNLK